MASLEILLPPLGPVDINGPNASANWEMFYQKFQLYLVAFGQANSTDEVKCALLLSLRGEDALCTYNSLKFSNDEGHNSNKFANLVAAFRNYPIKTLPTRRSNFHRENGKKGESFDQFLTSLKMLVRYCEYGEQEEIIVRDRIIQGSEDRALQEVLLRQDPANNESITKGTQVSMYKRSSLPVKVRMISSVHAAIKDTEVDKNFGDIPNCIAYIDDLICYGETEEEHDRAVKSVLDRTRKLGVKFNPNKVGMSIDPERTRALREIQPPKNLKELQCVLGMFNYARPFIQNMSEIEQSAELKEIRNKKHEYHSRDIPTLPYERVSADILAFGGNFAKEGRIELQFSSPRYVQSNGVAEKVAHIAKQLLRKCWETGTDYREALREYCNTPIPGIGVSPPKLLNSR
ncbi:hypothetical protein PR048_032542 [Dryococelus australis]|uniref:Reverse transcriptase domain-containing protein n=1 Tax=Dryococelus australis TaxID=614101 RepID=A0ABQ9G5C2_9NEOP|nr:hypothetical protein PR048_032542 [Dryococelus australis]